jgi:hypothetical protein
MPIFLLNRSEVPDPDPNRPALDANPGPENNTDPADPEQQHLCRGLISSKLTLRGIRIADRALFFQNFIF